MISLTLWFLVHLSVLCQIAVADQTGPPFYHCISEMCWTDINGSGTIAYEPLTDHITPETNILIFSNGSRARNGDIVLYSETSRPRISSYMLGTTTIRDWGDVFSRYIKDPHDGPYNDTIYGYMQSESPVPDPDTSIGSLEQDPLLVGLPESLRSAVDPASHLPTSNESCGPIPKQCLVAVAVSINIILVMIMAFNIVQVRRCLLLRPRSNEYGLPLHYN